MVHQVIARRLTWWRGGRNRSSDVSTPLPCLTPAPPGSRSAAGALPLTVDAPQKVLRSLLWRPRFHSGPFRAKRFRQQVYAASLRFARIWEHFDESHRDHISQRLFSVSEAPAEQADDRMCFVVSRAVLVAVTARFQEPSRKVTEE
jgi:hypothetical protein